MENEEIRVGIEMSREERKLVERFLTGRRINLIAYSPTAANFYVPDLDIYTHKPHPSRCFIHELIARSRG